jgi:hypothetical protein
LGEIVNFMIHHIMGEHAHRLENNLHFFKPRFPAYARAVAEKIAQPAAHINTVAFIDGTVRPMCRPSDLPGTNDAQHRVYSGHRRVHALKCQGVLSPDGMIMDLFGPVPGRRHDCFMLRESDINAPLAQLQAAYNTKSMGTPLTGAFPSYMWTQRRESHAVAEN